jgi:hypothetical protein
MTTSHLTSWTPVEPHPARWSPQVLEVIEPLIGDGWVELVHDPFAGDGRRLGALCNRLGVRFSGTDIEAWPASRPEVLLGDSADARTYPYAPSDATRDARATDGYGESFAFATAIVTSPVYLTTRMADYANGPTAKTNLEGRRDYALALGRPLHPENLARHTGRASRGPAYWAGHAACVAHWAERVIVNIDGPIAEGWEALLVDHGYWIAERYEVRTPRHRGLANDSIRAEHEVVLGAWWE